MGVVARHSLTFSIIYYFGVILGYINTILLFPNILTPDEFGLTRILLSVGIVVAQIAQVGTPGMVIRYFPEIKERIYGIGLLLSTIGITVVLGLIFLLKPQIISFYIENSALFTDHFLLLIPFGIAIVYFNLLDACLRTIYKNSFSTFLVNVVLRLIWLGLILAYYFEWLNFEQFIYLYSFSYGLISIAALVYLRSHSRIPIDVTTIKEERSFLKEISSYNMFILLAGLSSFLINKIDIIMLGSMESLSVLAIYAIAAYMGSVIRVPASSIARTAQVLVSEAFKNNKIEDIKVLYKKSSITQFVLSMGIFLLILVNYDNILYLLKDEYSGSYFIFLILGLTQVIDSGMGINGFIMINSPYYKNETIFSSILLVVTVISNLYFIPKFGAIGAAFATLLSIGIYNVLRLVFIYVKYNMIPFTVKAPLALFIGIASFASVYFIPFLFNFIVDAFIRSAIWAIVFIGLSYVLKISPDINKMIEQSFGKVKGIVKGN